jgi:Leucine-rich repeat (LRR) protein
LESLEYLWIDYNYISSTIPSILGRLTNLKDINLHNNLITGSIPPEIGNCTNLYYFGIHYNNINGSIPNSFKKLKNLLYFKVQYNSLSSTIPSGMINPKLQIFDVGHNKLTGSIPSYLGLPFGLIKFYACNNRLSHSFPLIAFYTAVSLVYLDIKNNQMTGDFTYDLNTSSIQLSKLEQIDISNNYFTGELPAIVFELPKLVIFNAGGNCIKGKLPHNLCNSTLLSTLILNGLYSASVCRNLIVPNFIFNFKTYYSRANVIEDIPDCIYNMRSLNTLFLSGNGITGTLSKDIVFSPNLQNLVFSNNRIEGEIPRQISERSWQNLDLSNNKLDGTLSSSFHGVSNESSLALNNNRISGDIPSSLMNALHINILSSNIFSCESLFVRGPLPENNPKNKS